MIEGPITGGAHGWAFGRSRFDLSERGYVEQEFFLSGEATTYQGVEGTELGRDGCWQVQPSGAMPFKTRLLVYRPADPARFNGKVVVCWNNVTAGYELFHGESPELLDGYAFVGATAQRVGVHGFSENSQGLAAWDPERYGALNIPSDAASYDIFAQVGRAVGPARDRSGVDPLGGLDVQKVIAIGASQSAARLGTYMNAIHPIAPVFDGFMLQIYFGGGAPLVGDRTMSPASRPRRALRGSNLIRELDVPAMIVNSELEAIACYGVRQPDTDRFVTWESAGTTHVSAQAQAVRNQKYAREFGVQPPLSQRMNRISIIPFYDAAVHHLSRWVDGGAAPPSQPLIEFAGPPQEGKRPEVVRDEHGIAVGGARLPQAQVPVATNSSIPVVKDFAGSLRGTNERFGANKLDALYGSEADYLARFRAATEAAIEAGVMLPRELEPAVEEAAQEYRRARE